MTQQVINTGTSANSKNGDPIRTAFNKSNDNFTDLYTNYISKTQLKAVVAASTSFADFQARIAAL